MVSCDTANGPDADEPIVALELSAVAEEAEAEALAAEARAAAATARARAIRLRRNAEATQATATPQAATTIGDPGTTEDGPEPEPASQQVELGSESADAEPQRVIREESARRIRWPRILASVGATVLICASGAATGVMWWQHRQAARDQQHSLEFVGAARQGVIDLMSLNFSNAKDDVQRLINDTSGDFRKDLESHRDDFITAVQDSKIITTGEIKAVAVQSISDNDATVLVAASSKVSNVTGASQEQRTWRVTVTLTRNGGQLKMSKVEFMP